LIIPENVNDDCSTSFGESAYQAAALQQQIIRSNIKFEMSLAAMSRLLASVEMCISRLTWAMFMATFKESKKIEDRILATRKEAC
jgi:hypothetical protein